MTAAHCLPACLLNTIAEHLAETSQATTTYLPVYLQRLANYLLPACLPATDGLPRPACFSGEISDNTTALPAYLRRRPDDYSPALPACLLLTVCPVDNSGEISDNTTALPAYLRRRPERLFACPACLPAGLLLTVCPVLPVFAERSRTTPLPCLLTCGDVPTIIRLLCLPACC